ncbi:MAG: Lrp/AsnC family transcriptional regulator [Calditrichaeota bacterium]|nr:MAG: Lrp/AsnC family transcriptional regulator [Calditrichota bacterium]
MRNKIDAIDVTILEILQKQARTKRNEIAEIVGLSLPSVSERISKLKENGYIAGFHTHLEPRRLGLNVTAFIFVNTDLSEEANEISRNAREHPFVQECHSITGAGSHIMKVRVRDIKHLDDFLGVVRGWPGVKNTQTNIVLSTAKETMDVPVREIVEL